MLVDKLTKEQVAFWEEVAKWTDVYLKDSYFVVEDVYDLESYLREKVNDNIRINHGVSKIAISLKRDETMPVVMKVGFDGYYDEYEDVDDGYVDFVGAEINGVCVDGYAEAEYGTYLELKNIGCEDYFSETELFIEANDRKFFLQERCVTFVETGSSCSKETVKKVSDRINNGDVYDLSLYFIPDWLGDVYEAYGEKGLEDLDKCLTEYDCDIFEDMHVNNYGYRAINHSPVILDYSKWDY